jgi:hypothetical protein
MARRGAVRRELNEIEYFNWCVGQPYNMVVAVQIRGDVTAGRLREALDRAQRRHPLLGVNTEPGPKGIPWFSSEGVDAIPLAVVERAGPEVAQRLADSELRSTFAMDDARQPRLPLLRVALLRPRDPDRPVDVVFTVQHVIADGLSMVFLVRDLLRFMEHPEAPVTVLDAPANDADLLSAAVRRRIPTTDRRFRIVLRLASAWAWLRLGRRPEKPRKPAQYHLSFELTPEQTDRLGARCRREGVSVQSAVCTAFLPGFPAVHVPVNLRPLLARDVGESVGLFIGAVEVQLRYRPAPGLWENARRLQRRLRSGLRKPFGVYQLFSKAVPAEAVRRLGTILVRLTSNRRPFAVTNLGALDGDGIRLQGDELQIESFFGAVSGILESSVLTVYTIGGRMRLHILATEDEPASSATRDEASRAVRRLVDAIGA